MTDSARGARLDEAPPRRPLALRRALALCALLLVAVFVALGSWQVQRLQWKEALIVRVEQRVHGVAREAPGEAVWPQFKASASAEEYRHVRLSGVFLHSLSSQVQASTELGGGFWLVTPLCRADGSIVLVNRGFIAPARGAPLPAPVRASGQACAPFTGTGAQPGAVLVTGLLRLSEPNGAFLRHNDALANRWFSRDVSAIASARGLGRVAPFFVDADAAAPSVASAAGQPVGGLTVIHFHNNHLVYAFTWYALALMVVAAGVWLVREERRAPSDGAGQHTGARW